MVQAGVPPQGRIIRFGPFEVDLASREIRKQGLRLKLQEQPFQVLAALLEHPGDVVAREELIRLLWPDGTIVDYDRGLNAALTRLRQALSDSADVPRYVETVARRGYRFIGVINKTSTESTVVASPQSPRYRKQWAFTALIVLVGAGAILWGTSRLHRGTAGESILKFSPLSSAQGIERCPSFSPDGNQIAYEWDKGDGRPHIYIRVIGAGDPVRVTSGDAVEYGPAWSPDGRLVAFFRRLDHSSVTDQATVGVFVAPPFGGIERKVAENVTTAYVHFQHFPRLDWTRDSKHLILSVPDHPGRGEGLLLVSLEDGARSWLTKPSDRVDYGDWEPAVSPDGRTLAFVRGERTGNQAIYLLPLGADLRPTSAPRRLDSAAPGRSPAWTSNGREIVFASSNASLVVGSGIFRIGLKAGDKPQPVSVLGKNVLTPAVSGTGRLAYSVLVRESNIFRQEIPIRMGLTPMPINLTRSSAVDTNAQYSPDGSRIAFASTRTGRWEIWTCNSDGYHCFQLTAFNEDFMTGSPRWSPDGKQLAFDSALAGKLDVYVVDANGGSPRRLTEGSAAEVAPSWSRDGKWIYLSSTKTGRSEIWKIPSAGGSAIQVTRNGGWVAFESPDAQHIYYLKAELDATLFSCKLDGSGESAVLNGVAYRGYVVTADCIYYLRREPEGKTGIRCFRLASHEDIQIGSIDRPLYLGLSLSPNGKYLIYSDLQQNSNLMLAEHFH